MSFFIFIIAFIIRVVYVIQLKSTIFYSHFLLDEAFYDSWAGSIAGGRWLGEKAFNALPLFPYLLGIVYKLVGHNLFVPRLIGAALSSFSCVLIYLITKRCFSKQPAVIAGLIACFYGPLIFYSGVLAPTTITITLYLFSLWFLFRVLDKPSFFRFFLFGFIVGFAVLAKAGILLFMPAVLIWVVAIFHEKKKALIAALAALIGLLVVIFPVSLRNYLVSGEMVFLTSHSGINFYIGNNEKATGRFKPPQWARSNIEGVLVDTRAMAQTQAGRQLKDSEVSRFYFNKGLRFIRESPPKFIKLLGRKLFLFINRQEIFDVAHYFIYREHIPILQFPFIGFLLIGPLALAGILIGISRWKKIMPLYLFILTYTASILAFFINSRYRMPLAIIMIIFAGFSISWLLEKLRNKRYFVALLVVAFCLMVSVFISLPTGIQTGSAGYNNLGNLYIAAGEWDKAISAFNRSKEFDNSDPKPDNDIGYVYIMQNKLNEAERSLTASLAKNPKYPFAHINMGLLHEKRADFRSAEREYKEAIRLNPNIPQAHNNLANIYEKTRRRWQAIEAYKRAIRLSPGYSRAHYNLGIVYGREGRLVEAEEEFERALQLNPKFAPARQALGYFKKSP